MNEDNKVGGNDLVSVWMDTNGIPAPALTHKVFFEFSPANLIVSSNNETFIEKISNRLRHYREKSGEIHSMGKEVIEAEVITINESGEKKSINLPASWDGIPMDLTSPKGFQVFKTDFFYHLKIDHREAVWRPHDLLVSFSLGEEKVIKFLIAEAPESVTPFQKTGALKRKGPVDWEEISDMVVMILMRLFDFFCLHAASLIVKDRGVIISGSSGSGKTTTALSLIQNGATLLSDELTLLPTKTDQNLPISGIFVDPRLFPQSRGNKFSIEASGPRKDNWQKKPVMLPDEIFRKGICKKVKPTLILFLDLKKNNPPDHILHRMEKQEAVTGLISQVLDPFNSTRHKDIFETVFRLVTRCSLYRLELGKNLEKLPQCIAGLL